jgi:1-hydroxycarotenoid 3,4-desaturase
MHAPHVAIIGAGIAGLSAALDLAVGGARITVLERLSHSGGKLRTTAVADTCIDAGPTVFTLRSVFDELFMNAGARLEERIALHRAQILARHAWSEDQRLDLFADEERTVEAIGRFAGAQEAARYRRFAADAKRMFRTLDQSFMRAPRAGPLALVRRVGLTRLPDLMRIRPFDTLWRTLGGYFRDARLRQLFARYSTYCGSSPFQAPATMMLIAHVEQKGVWLLTDGMGALADGVAQLAREHGAEIRLNTEATALITKNRRISGVQLATGEFIPVDAVIVNADVAAVAEGRFGEDAARAVPKVAQSQRSLSAVTWALLGRPRGFPLVRHSVFFSPDYAAEFEQIFRRRQLPAWPTVYVCAQDRDACEPNPPLPAERLLCLVNAPADGDSNAYDTAEIELCERRTFTFLERCGLQIERSPRDTVVTTPAGFEHLFPGTGGALYGQVNHGWRASFTRPGARTRLAGLYLAGGSVHPGPGLPMAALSGRLAAASVLEDFPSTPRFHPTATPGGTSMR